MPAIIDKTLANQYLQHEIDQAWIHYRHLEEMRYKYLSVLATLLTASVAAFTGGVTAAGKYFFPDVGPPTLAVVAGMSCFLLLLFAWSGLFLTAIIRIGYVLAAYEDVLIATREHFCGFESNACAVWSIRDRIPKPICGLFFSLQNNAVVLLYFVCVFLTLLELGLSGWLWQRTGHFYLAPTVFAGFMCVALVFAFATNLKGGSRQLESKKGPSPYVSLTDVHNANCSMRS